jgi:prevent-host-death family protein
MNAPPKITVMSSRDFNQQTARAKKAAERGPVFVASRGTPTHVLLSKAEYDRLKAAEQTAPAPKPFVSLADLLAQKDGGDFDFDFPEFKGPSTLRIPDFD